MTKTIHMSVTKAWFRRCLIEDGPAQVFENPETKKLSLDEALAALEADPREVFTIGHCDNQAPDGSCLGHVGEEDEA